MNLYKYIYHKKISITNYKRIVYIYVIRIFDYYSKFYSDKPANKLNVNKMVKVYNNRGYKKNQPRWKIIKHPNIDFIITINIKFNYKEI